MTAPGAVDGGRVFVAGLAALPSMTPSRLRIMLRHHPPDELWRRLRAGVPLASRATGRMNPDTLAALVHEAAHVDPARVAAACEAVGARVLLPDDPGFPPQLVADRDPPAVLFVRGSLAPLTARRVGIVGTRNATAAGRATAHELGAALAAAGVTVVSGLALGIDGAAHRGVRDAGGAPVAVVGSGIDVPYPRQHRELWEWVASDGLLMSEWPAGVDAQAWHFPVRNRIVAALSEVLVVVESRERGGSLITVDEAADRGITVMAVPGSVHCRAANGTNQLLKENSAQAVTTAADVLLALGLDTSRMGGAVPLPLDASPARPAPPAEHTLEARVFALCVERPRTLDDLVVGLGVSVADAAMAAARLEVGGWLTDTGGWFEPVGSKLGAP